MVYKNDGSHQCGATLISSKFAISAAHCFIYDDTKDIAHYSKFDVIAGAFHNTDEGLEKKDIATVIRQFEGEYSSTIVPGMCNQRKSIHIFADHISTYLYSRGKKIHSPCNISLI